MSTNQALYTTLSIKKSNFVDLIGTNDLKKLIKKYINQKIDLQKKSSDCNTEHLKDFNDIQQDKDSENNVAKSIQSIEERLKALEYQSTDLFDKFENQQKELLKLNTDEIKEYLKKYLILIRPTDMAFDDPKEEIVEFDNALFVESDNKEPMERKARKKSKPKYKFVIEPTNKVEKSTSPIRELKSAKVPQATCVTSLYSAQESLVEKRKIQFNDYKNFNPPKQRVQKQSEKQISIKGIKSSKTMYDIPIGKVNNVLYKKKSQMEVNVFRFTQSKETVKVKNRNSGIPICVPRKDLKVSLKDIETLKSGGIVVLKED